MIKQIGVGLRYVPRGRGIEWAWPVEQKRPSSCKQKNGQRQEERRAFDFHSCFRLTYADFGITSAD